MNVELRYFSGTGNSHKVLDTCNDVFLQNGCKTTLQSITETSDLSHEADLIGFCFPVYAFGLPRICRNYLSALPRFQKPISTFLLITAGAADEAGFSVDEGRSILKRKGLDVTYSQVIQMPINWTVVMNPPSREEAQPIIETGVAQATEAAQNILRGVARHHTFNYPAKHSKFNFYKDYYLFKWLGVGNLWRDFRADENCDSCGLCEKLCPTRSIRMVDEKPQWSNTCEQCMRCVNYCPRKAIFQKAEGSIEHRNTYHEPTFRPLKESKE